MNRASVLVAISVAAFGGLIVAIWSMNRELQDYRRKIDTYQVHLSLLKEATERNFGRLRETTETSHGSLKEHMVAELYDIKRELRRLPPRPHLNAKERQSLKTRIANTLPNVGANPDSNQGSSTGPVVALGRAWFDAAHYRALSIVGILKTEKGPQIGDPIPDFVMTIPVSGTLLIEFPQLRGYEFFAGRDAVVLVDPKDKRIVDIVW